MKLDERLLSQRRAVKAKTGDIVLMRQRDALFNMGQALRIGVVTKTSAQRTYYRSRIGLSEEWVDNHCVLAIVPSAEDGDRIAREINQIIVSHSQAVNDLNARTLDRYDALVAQIDQQETT